MTWDEAHDLALSGDEHDEAPTLGYLFSAPSHPHVDRMPAHVMTGVMVDEWDAELVCVPECPACMVEHDLATFWDEVGGYPTTDDEIPA